MTIVKPQLHTTITAGGAVSAKETITILLAALRKIETKTTMTPHRITQTQIGVGLSSEVQLVNPDQSLETLTLISILTVRI